MFFYLSAHLQMNLSINLTIYNSFHLCNALYMDVSFTHPFLYLLHTWLCWMRKRPTNPQFAFRIWSLSNRSVNDNRSDQNRSKTEYLVSWTKWKLSRRILTRLWQLWKLSTKHFSYIEIQTKSILWNLLFSVASCITLPF